MTDGNTGPGTDGARAGRDRLTLVLGGGLAVALLAAIGATGGWLLAGEDTEPTGRPVAGASTGVPTGSPSAAPSRAEVTPTAPRSTSPTRSTGLTVPPLIGTDFVEARDELRERRLGWRLIFGTGTGRSVTRTSPAVGEEVRPGTTVHLYVAGPAPASTVPDVVGEECDDAADELVDEGFYPRYRSGRRGVVTRQEPAGDTAGNWNDPVALWCGVGAPGSVTASPVP
ncbi:PASTA domain-containing protein [Micromonospora sp. C28SCA-DRY-2]|uniref:PASTA domain-containing protein n=1 Tax=Micromonospora sp. C28SCA-DRY-2 TaxID=3059522 RepID=UPI002675FE14|nr:PASTA domain-containing protein [Micromonospora sp. C28SCA-DRY-2]MDO3705465.1 PASTA domain-containing protein [Micromonospora sp. C28SCA-DRY-2]